MASVRAPATPSRENSCTAASRMAARLSSGRPREPNRGLEGGVFSPDLMLINQLVRLYKACARRTNLFPSRQRLQSKSFPITGRIMKYRKLGRTGFPVSELAHGLW